MNTLFKAATLFLKGSPSGLTNFGKTASASDVYNNNNINNNNKDRAASYRVDLLRRRVRAEVVLRRKVDRDVLLLQVEGVVRRVGRRVLQCPDGHDHLIVR